MVNYFLAWGLPSNVVDYPLTLHWRKLIFPLLAGYMANNFKITVCKEEEEEEEGEERERGRKKRRRNGEEGKEGKKEVNSGSILLGGRIIFKEIICYIKL